MRLYWHLIMMNIRSQMQYRISFLLTVFGQFITAFSSFFGLYFIFLRINAVDDFAFEQVLLCFAVVVMSFSLGELVGGGLAVFPRILGNGEFDRTLVRPRSVILQVIVPKMDLTRIGLLLQAVLVLCYAIPNSGFIWTLDKAFTLCLMIICGSALFFGLFLIYASFSFFTVEGMEFMNILTYGGRQFGRYPFSVYGDGVLKFLTFVVPLASFQYYPLLYLMGREHGLLYMLSPLLGLLFLIPSYAFYRFGLRRYRSVGS